MPATLEPPAVSEAAKPTGIDAMTANMDTAWLAGKNVDGTTIATDKPAEAAPAVTPPSEVSKKTHDPFSVPEKPVVKLEEAVTPPVAAAKPGEPEMSVEDMEKFLKAHSNKKPWKVYETLKSTTAAKVSELEGKLKALESKPVQTAGDEAKIAAYEKRIEALTGETKSYQQKLAETDYTHTPAYQAHVKRANRIHGEAMEFIKGVTVTTEDGSTRVATSEDFDYIRALPIGKRKAAANAAFGDNGSDIVDFARQIDNIKKESDYEAQEYAQNHEKNSIQREMESKNQTAQFETRYRAGLSHIAKNPRFGKWFSADPADPEGTKLFQDGLAEIERVVNDDKISLEEAADHAALSRAKAAALPRVLVAYNRLEAKAKALEDELAKFRSTDPGAKGATSGGGVQPDSKPKGIDAMTATFDMDPGLVNRR